MRAPVLTFFRRQNGRAFFPALPNAAQLPRRWRGHTQRDASWDIALQLVLFRSTEKET